MHGTWRHELFLEAVVGDSVRWPFKEYGHGGCTPCMPKKQVIIVIVGKINNMVE